MNPYELILIFDPKLGEEGVDKSLAKIEDIIKKSGGEVDKVDKWGIKRLFSVMGKAKKLTQANYVLVCFSGETSLPGKLRSYIKVNENIIRHTIMKAVPKGTEEVKEIKGEPLSKEEATIAAAPVPEKEIGQSQ